MEKQHDLRISKLLHRQLGRLTFDEAFSLKYAHRRKSAQNPEREKWK